MTCPLVSVVIPAYNHEGYVAQCLDSVINDSYENKEVIIIDDGSSDGTPDVIREWIVEHGADIHCVFLRQENRGVSATLNRGISLSSGEFIVFIASDDYLLPGGIAARVEYLMGRPQISAVFGDCIVVNENGEKIFSSGLEEFHHADKSVLSTPKNIAHEIVWRWSVPGPVLLSRKNMFDVIGQFDEKRRIEDWDLYLRIVASYSLDFINIPVAAYRVHSTNTCMDQSRQAFIMGELAKSGFKRAKLFKNTSLRAKLYYRSFIYLIKSLQLKIISAISTSA